MKAIAKSTGRWETILVDVVGFQVVWLCCALGAAAGSAVPGIAASLAFVTLQLARSVRKPATACLIAAAGLLGILAESLFSATGAVHHAAPWPSVLAAPLWIVGLWIAFATTLGTLGRWLGRRKLTIALIAGALLGPVSYLAGARLGALSLGEPMAVSLSVIAGGWAFAMPLLLWIGDRFDPPALDGGD